MRDHGRSATTTATSIALTCASLVACSPSEPRDGSQLLTWIDTIDVEENSSVVNVTPRIAPDPETGGFLVADQRESQVRVYNRRGRLISHFGSLGQGPGEFQMVTALRRLRDGTLIAAEWNGRISIIREDGSSSVTTSTGLIRLEDMEVLNDSLVALTGFNRSLPDDQLDTRIHILDYRRGQFVSQFFIPEPLARKSQTAMMAGWTKIAVKADTIAAVFSLTDSVYVYTIDGVLIDRVGFGQRWFRRATDEPATDVARDPNRRAEWLLSLDFVGDVQFLPNGEFGVLLQRFIPGTALSYAYELLRIDRAGNVVSRVDNVPQVLLMVPETDTIITVDPTLEVPNRWLIARWP